MRIIPLTRRQRMLVQCAPIRDERVDDRAMRAALHRARKDEQFAIQRNFDQAVAALAREIPIPAGITEWVPTEALISPGRRVWKKQARQPAILAIAIAVVVIAAVAIFNIIEHLKEFPGQTTARRLLTVASSTHAMMLDPVKTDAGSLGDLFFMKHRLAHYDVPPEFADFRTLGCRVFDDEDGERIAQVWLVEKKMQLFLFPAERDPKTGVAREFSGWRYVDQDRWTGVVKEHNGVCFMAALRGSEKDLAPYISKTKD
jgi:hypothetical protein